MPHFDLQHPLDLSPESLVAKRRPALQTGSYILDVPIWNVATKQRSVRHLACLLIRPQPEIDLMRCNHGIGCPLRIGPITRPTIPPRGLFSI